MTRPETKENCCGGIGRSSGPDLVKRSGQGPDWGDVFSVAHIKMLLSNRIDDHHQNNVMAAMQRSRKVGGPRPPRILFCLVRLASLSGSLYFRPSWPQPNPRSVYILPPARCTHLITPVYPKGELSLLFCLAFGFFLEIRLRVFHRQFSLTGKALCYFRMRAPTSDKLWSAVLLLSLLPVCLCAGVGVAFIAR
jgi:hypothetical protein